jgi:hypothetical protein
MNIMNWVTCIRRLYTHYTNIIIGTKNISAVVKKESCKSNQDMCPTVEIQMWSTAHLYILLTECTNHSIILRLTQSKLFQKMYVRSYMNMQTPEYRIFQFVR